jgi:hypothetical protein
VCCVIRGLSKVLCVAVVLWTLYAVYLAMGGKSIFVRPRIFS